ncbi:MAG: alpha/beta fold hydrolase [Thermoanaerobaculia bacterium]
MLTHWRLAIAIAVLAFVAVFAYAADPVDDVRRTEIAFAKAFADRDQERFFSFVADDATFLSLTTLSGKAKVIERWSRYLQGPEAPFAWGPERVAVNAAGTIALSTDPVFARNGSYIGNFNSTWVKQQDGSWKILYDSTGPSAATFAEDAVKVEEGFVNADDGLKLYYRKAGSSPITVILPLDSILHDDFRQLADIATVITYDMRNRGRSGRMKDVSTMTLQHDVRDLEAVRKHFNVERFVPVGYSYVGKVVVLYAMEHPERVSRVIQLGPVQMAADTKFPNELTHGYDDMGAPEAAVTKWQEMQKSGAAAKTPREFCEAQWQVFQYLVVGDPKNASRVKVTCDLENEWPVNFDAHIKPVMESLAKTPLTKESVKAVKVPVLTIHGTKDRNAPYGSGREWAMSLPDARLVTVEGGAHASWIDDPVTVFSAIRAFIRGSWPMGVETVTKLGR